MKLEFDSVDDLLTEASKIMHMDRSHSAIRSKLQSHLDVMHRTMNPDNPYPSPYIQDVFGGEDEGHVVHSKGYGSDSEHTVSKYKKGSDGGYVLSDHKKVKRAYVTAQESALIPELTPAADEPQSSVTEAASGELVIMEEAAFNKSGRGTIKMIGPGTGSSAHYSAEALKKMVENGLFDGDIHMFLDHPTKEERMVSGTGSISKLAGIARGKAEYQENGKAGAGVYKSADAYPEYRDFLNSRSKDIGLSVALGVSPLAPSVRPKVSGVPALEASDVKAVLSCDFVSKAGADGKMVTMFESFRQRQPLVTETQRPSAAETRSNMEIDDKTLQSLQEAAKLVPGLVARVDRLEEENQTLRADRILSESLATSGLNARAQNRVRKVVLSNIPLKDGKLDTATLTESAKTAIKDEQDYIRENGGRVGKPVVSGLGATPQTETQEDLEKVLEASNKSLDDAMHVIYGTKGAN